MFVLIGNSWILRSVSTYSFCDITHHIASKKYHCMVEKQ